MQLGRYQILKELAAGSVTDVLLARANGLEGFARHVVIKRIRPETAREERFVAAFLEEARIAGSLHHHNIVQVHDVGEQDGSYFFAMEYVHGEDLRKLIARVQQRNQVVPVEHAIAIASSTAAGLHHAHEQKSGTGERLGLVHRDVSPSNILIGYDGSVKLVDFGMAKAVARSATTASGALKTKASYMSPEQCVGKPVDRRTDVFALGVVLFELVTGQRLFKGKNEFLTMAAIVDGEIPRPSTLRREVPPALDEIIMRSLQKDPDVRYQTAEAFRESLEAFAIAQELRISNKALADYLVSQFGVRTEPWEHGAIDEPLADLDGTQVKGVVPAPSASGTDLYDRLSPGAESPLALARPDHGDEWSDDDENVPTAGKGRGLHTHPRGQTQDVRPPSDVHRRTRPSRVLPAQPDTAGDTTATNVTSNLDDTVLLPGTSVDDTAKRNVLDTAQSATLGDRTATREIDDAATVALTRAPRDAVLDVQTVIESSRAHQTRVALTAPSRAHPRASSEEIDGRTVVEPPNFDRVFGRASAAPNHDDDDDDPFASEPATRIDDATVGQAGAREREIARRAAAAQPKTPPLPRPSRPSVPPPIPTTPPLRPSPPAGYRANPLGPPIRPAPPAPYAPPSSASYMPPPPGRASPPAPYLPPVAVPPPVYVPLAATAPVTVMGGVAAVVEPADLRSRMQRLFATQPVAVVVGIVLLAVVVFALTARACAGDPNSGTLPPDAAGAR